MTAVPHAPRRVLLVEDEGGLRRLMAQVLELDGLAVVDVGSVREALVQDGPWDALILDRRLPNGDGRRVAEHFHGVPTLYVSGLEDADLKKPFTIDELRSAVATRLEEHP